MEDGEFLRNYYNFQNGVTYLVLVQKKLYVSTDSRGCKLNDEPNSSLS